MAGKPSRALLQARSELLDKEIARHDLEVECTTLRERLDAYFTNEQVLQTRLDETEAMNLRLADRNVELEKNVAEMGQQVVDQGARLKQLLTEISDARSKWAAAERAQESAEKDNDYLRDQLNTLTIRSGHMEGQITVLREFAPVPERDRYLDQLPRRDRRSSIDSAAVYAREDDAWHHRRA